MIRIIRSPRALGCALIAFASLGCGDDGSPADGGDGGAGGTGDGTTTSTSASTTSAGGAGTGGTGGAEAQGGGGGSTALPDSLVLTGEASGTSDDGTESVTCTLGGQMVDLVSDGDSVTGVFSGEFLRRVEVGELAFAFEPFLGGPASIERLPGDMAELRLVGDQPDDAKPYWLRIEVLQAEEVAPNEFEGTWSCAPLEIDGNPPDFTTTVDGTFRLAPPE